MAKTPKNHPQAGAAAPNLVTERRIARTAAEKATENLRDKIVVALVGFVLTGVIGTILTTWIQQRGWTWQNRVSKIEKDVENAMATYRTASELVNARWFATYRMSRLLERDAAGKPSSAEEWKAARDAFDTTDRDWALRYTSVAREIEFYVDTPFGIDGSEMMPRVWNLTCSDFALRGTPGSAVDARSARVVLEVINHCHGKMKDEIESLIDRRGTGADTAERKVTLDLSYRRLDHLYRTNETLRCVIFERALAIRAQITSESYWGTFFGIGTPNYDAAVRPRDCVG